MARNPNSPGGRKPPRSSMSTKNRRHTAVIEGDAEDVTPQSTTFTSAQTEKQTSTAGSVSDDKKKSGAEAQKSSTSSDKPDKGSETKTQPQSQTSAKSATGSSTEKNSAKTSGTGKSAADAKDSRPEKQIKTDSGSSQIFTHLAAGGLGAVLILGLAWLLGLFSVPSDPGKEIISELHQRLKNLESAVDQSKLGDIETKLSGKLANIETRLAKRENESAVVSKSLSELETFSKELQSDYKSGAAVIGKFEPRMARLEGTIKSLASAAQGEQGGDISKAAGFSVQLNELEARLNKEFSDFKTAYYLNQSRQKNLSSEDLAGVRKDLDRISGKIASDLQSLKAQRDDASSKLDRLESASGQLTQELNKVRSGASELSQSFAALENKIGAFSSNAIGRKDISNAVAPINSKLAELDKSVTAMLKRERLEQIDIQRAALTISLGKLQRAVDQGHGFASELDAVKKLAPKDLNLDALSSYRVQGIPSAENLSRQFASVASKSLKADRTPEEGSILSRIYSNARSVVRVRRTGEVKGDSTEAVIARMEVRIKNGDLKGALTESEGLTGPALDAAMPWLKQVRARLSVNQAMEKIESQLISSISNSAQHNSGVVRQKADDVSSGSSKQ